METINLDQAQIELSQLLVRVENGEEIIIANQGIPIAKLVPFHPAANRRRSLGSDRGRFVVPENFNSLPTEVLTAFEGET
jgi:prevent-host-death family protein